jgi:hypothetical protein
MTNTTSMPRIGLRRLNRALDRPLLRRRDRCLDVFAIHLAAGRRPPPINWLREANKILGVYVRLREESLKRSPEETSLEAWNRYQREREQAALQAEIDAALNKVYGVGSPAIATTGSEMVQKRFT